MSAEFFPKKIHMIIGHSGAGKTTFLKLLNGLIKPLSGRIKINNAELEYKKLTPRKEIGYIPQDMGLIQNLSVEHNILLGVLHRTNSLKSVFNIFPKKEKELADHLLESLGIAEKKFEKVKYLSGGQKRRVAIARALIQKPKILLADEILSDIDFIQANKIMENLKKIKSQMDVTIIMVEHDMCITRQFADELSIIKRGSLLHDININELLESDACKYFL